MTDENTKVTRGEIILFSSGSYSDYGYCGEVIFLKDAELIDARDAYKAHSQKSKESAGTHGFVTWMVANEYCVPLKAREIRIGDYGDILGEDCYGWNKEHETKNALSSGTYIVLTKIDEGDEK